MIKKTISYTDFNGVNHTDDFYFNLSKAEVIQMELSAEGNSLVENIQKIIESNNGKEILGIFKTIIGQSYGVKSEDGKRFVKSEELTKDFESTAAYSELYTEMFTDASAASAFMRALLPADLQGSMDSDLTPSEQIRKASEAAMQGRRSAQVKPKATIATEPELPRSDESTPVGMTAAEYEEFKQYKSQQAGQIAPGLQNGSV